MGKITGIEWTNHTFNPWWGCERVSPACAHCYAADIAARWTGDEGLWSGSFRFLSDGYWRKPIAWNAEAEAAREPRFVFCASMADVYQEHPDLIMARGRLFRLIDATPWLVWLLLTKRPENIYPLSPWGETGAPPNVWLGTSIENARQTHRVQKLLRVQAPAHFLSCEPLLGSLFDSSPRKKPLDLHDVEWVIGGGESGPKFRALNSEYARELRDACKAAGVPFFWKQNGGRWPKQTGKKLDGREWCERPTPTAPQAMALALF